MARLRNVERGSIIVFLRLPRYAFHVRDGTRVACADDRAAVEVPISGKHSVVNMTRTLCAMAVALLVASGAYAQDAVDSTLTTRAYQSKFFSRFNAFELFYASIPIEHRWCAAQSLADFPWHETFLAAFRRGIHGIEEQNPESGQYSGEGSFALLHEIANNLESGACEYRVMFAVEQSVRDKLTSDEQQELAKWLPVVHAPVAEVSAPSVPAPVPTHALPPRPNASPAAQAPVAEVSAPSAPAPVPTQASPPRSNVVFPANAQVPTPRPRLAHAAAHPTAPKARTAPLKKSARKHRRLRRHS